MIPGIDPQTPTWRALRRHIEAEIEQHRTRLETGIDHDTTAYVRGQVAALRSLLAAAEPPRREDAQNIADGPPLY